MRTIEINGCYRFTYPNYGTPDSHPDYTAHSGQVVTVERQLTDKECDPECQPSYRIKAVDGWTGTAHASELRKVKGQPMKIISNRRLGRKGQKTIGISALK